jgi:hypothetical protein|tara:strand:+ start:99 stop:296 length:198 start_codon:yes stop_codon:yes gene_type:complete
MDVIQVVQFIQKTTKERRQSVHEILGNNGIRTMEQYQKLMGELDALFYVEQELSGLLEKQEQFDV